MICKRCGNCCVDVGRTFWKHGIGLEPEIWNDCPDLKKRAKDGDHEDDDLPCEMLRFENDQAVCLIQKNYGYAKKPMACRLHEGDKRCNHLMADRQRRTLKVNSRGGVA